MEGLQANVQRLKTYKAKLVVFPRRAHKLKVLLNGCIWFNDMIIVLSVPDVSILSYLCQAGDSAPEELANATQVQGEYMPIVREKPSVELVKVTNEMKSFKAYDKLRIERTNARHVGARMKKAAEAEKEEKK